MMAGIEMAGRDHTMNNNNKTRREEKDKTSSASSLVAGSSKRGGDKIGTMMDTIQHSPLAS
jgi:hypothetical protein